MFMEHISVPKPGSTEEAKKLNITYQKTTLRITQTGKIQKYVEHGLKAFQDNSRNEEFVNIILILSGKGPTVTKTITIAEILKRKTNSSLHQYTQIGRSNARENIDDAINNILNGDEDSETTVNLNYDKDDNG
ncbi:15133_t:CDS:2, partial [Dentiscutata erythropus]